MPIIKSVAQKGQNTSKSDFRGPKIPPRGTSSTWNTCTSPFRPNKFARVGRGGQRRSKYCPEWASLLALEAIFWPSLTPPANPVNFFWSKMACTGVPHIVLHVSCPTRTSGGYFRPSWVRIRAILDLWIYKNIAQKGQNTPNSDLSGPKIPPQRCELDTKHVVIYVGHLYRQFWTKKVWPGWQGGSGKVKIWPRMRLKQ